MKKLFVLTLIVFVVSSMAVPQVTYAGYSTGKETALNEQLKAIAKKTYRYFEDFIDPGTGLPYDSVRFENEKDIATHTSPTNIGMYLMSTTAAEEMGFLSHKEALKKIKRTLNAVEDLKKWNGLFYNWYETETGKIKKDWGRFISTVDNGWLSAALIVIGQAYPEVHDRTSNIVEAMDYSYLYDPEMGQMYGGYDVAKNAPTGFHYGSFYTEPRVASYLAIGKGDVPEDHWWKIFRTLPKEWSWQRQIPEGYTVNYDGIEVFEGHYEYKGIEYVPSWGGSMFEALMPSLVLKEKELGDQALGLNNKRHVKIQIMYAKDHEYPVWGFSPAAIPNGYSEFGVAPLGMSGYEDTSYATPHATFLALEYAPKQAIWENIYTLKDLGVYGKYGFWDSVNIQTGEPTQALLALDQGMTMVAIVNYLKDGIIRDYFHSSPIGSKPEHLLKVETFSIINDEK